MGERIIQNKAEDVPVLRLPFDLSPRLDSRLVPMLYLVVPKTSVCKKRVYAFALVRSSSC